MMVIKKEGMVWEGRRIVIKGDEMDGEKKIWKMKKGGIDKGEEKEKEEMREIYEEKGMK